MIIDSALGLLGGAPERNDVFLEEVRWLTKYLEEYQAPKFPFPVDQAKAAAGKTVFDKNCASCHWSERTGTVVPQPEVGTDIERIKSWNKDAAIRANDSVKAFGIERRGLVEADPSGYVAALQAARARRGGTAVLDHLSLQLGGMADFGAARVAQRHPEP